MGRGGKEVRGGAGEREGGQEKGKGVRSIIIQQKFNQI